ncbi:MAG TPA: PD-(D/E)XK nuclease family protein [Candidatus Woesebacteria bacterium]|nr:PD-(D/E)XK nuclease family protein [Candidatus Woesebacteria bacterium]
MAKDKFSAVWVSHTSINDYVHCPRAYFLKNVYKDAKTGHKVQIMSPHLALGQAVHEVLDTLSVIPTESRFDQSLVLKFDDIWEQYSGNKGGFQNIDDEHAYKERGKAMLRKVMENPGPLKNLAVKIQQDLPFYWLSEEENIILCGKVDWLEYNQLDDSVHIIDFKTGKKKEEIDSLQLPIYHLLVHHCQKRKVSKASYWYLETDNQLIEKELPDLKIAHQKVSEIARRIKLARKLDKFDCPQGSDGCVYCRSLEKIVRGGGELVHSNGQRDIYILPQEEMVEDELDSVIL